MRGANGLGKEKSRHITTIAGPQAEALLKMWKEKSSVEIKDRSVPGLSVIEIWAE